MRVAVVGYVGTRQGDVEIAHGLALQQALRAGRVCPRCGWFREREDDPLWGCMERDGLTFSVCPQCGADWPD